MEHDPEIAELLSFFDSTHLLPHLAEASRPFRDAAHHLVDSEIGALSALDDLAERLGAQPEREARAAAAKLSAILLEARRLEGWRSSMGRWLRLLLKAKDCAVRAVVARHRAEQADGLTSSKTVAVADLPGLLAGIERIRASQASTPSEPAGSKVGALVQHREPSEAQDPDAGDTLTRAMSQRVSVHGDTMMVSLWYPRVEGEPIKRIRLDLMDVRAADGLTISYDYERDGWTIVRDVTRDEDGVAALTGEIREVAFVPAWTEADEPPLDPEALAESKAPELRYPATFHVWDAGAGTYPWHWELRLGAEMLAGGVDGSERDALGHMASAMLSAGLASCMVVLGQPVITVRRTEDGEVIRGIVVDPEAYERAKAAGEIVELPEPDRPAAGDAWQPSPLLDLLARLGREPATPALADAFEREVGDILSRRTGDLAKSIDGQLDAHWKAIMERFGSIDPASRPTVVETGLGEPLTFREVIGPDGKTRESPIRLTAAKVGERAPQCPDGQPCARWATCVAAGGCARA